MKPAIHYTIRRGPYFSDFNVMAVTSERGTKCWGRDHRGDSTHARQADCHGRFATRDQAEKAINAIREIWKLHSGLDAKADRERAARHKTRDAEIKAAIERATSKWETAK